MHIEIIGYIAGFVTTMSLSPQLVKTWRSRSTRDISLYWTIIRIMGLTIWILYAIYAQILPLLICAFIECFMVSLLFLFKYVYH